MFLISTKYEHKTFYLHDRYERKRVEEEVEVVRRKASRLRSQIEGSPVVQRLQQELKEYKDILKCSICLERPKEVI